MRLMESDRSFPSLRFRLYYILVPLHTKFSSAKFQKNNHPSHIIFRIQRLEAKSVDLDEVAHDEPPHQDLHCL